MVVWLVALALLPFQKIVEAENGNNVAPEIAMVSHPCVFDPVRGRDGG
jgi:hypothetical protein